MPARVRRSGQTTYGWPHTRARTNALRHLRDGDPCCLCGQPMYREHAAILDLDHNPDGTGYRGLAHRYCNRRDGAIRGNTQRTHTRRRTRNW